jgi:hypothetical protein
VQGRHVLVAKLKDRVVQGERYFEEIHAWDQCDDPARGGGAIAAVLVGVIAAERLISEGELGALLAVGEDFGAEADFGHDGFSFFENSDFGNAGKEKARRSGLQEPLFLFYRVGGNSRPS